jgi:hypothetical protein
VLNAPVRVTANTVDLAAPGGQMTVDLTAPGGQMTVDLTADGGHMAVDVTAHGGHVSVEATILGALTVDEPQHIEDVITRCGMLPARVGATLMALELAGRVRQLEGQRWVAVGQRARRR